MHADDDSIPVPHDAFRMPRGALNWKAPYRTVLLLLAGAYGTLVLAGGITPSIGDPASSAPSALRLPLVAQLALGCAGLAALVWVLSRAVREVDKRPYVAIAPVFATFAGLVHTGLHVELLGVSSAVVAFGVLGVALIGGGLIARPDAQAQRLGWSVVIAPWLLLMGTLQLAKGTAPLAPVERAYALGLLFSSLVLGAAGVASRTLRSALTRRSPEPRPAEELAEMPTGVTPVAALDPENGTTSQQTVRARAVQLPRVRARLPWAALAAATLLYFGLRSVFGGHAPRAPVPVPAPARPSTPVVQQLSVPAAPAATAVREEEDHAPIESTPPAPREATPAAPAQPLLRPSASPTRLPAARKTAVSAPPSPPGLPAWDELEVFKSSSKRKPSATSPGTGRGGKK